MICLIETLVCCELSIFTTSEELNIPYFYEHRRKKALKKLDDLVTSDKHVSTNKDCHQIYQGRPSIIIAIELKMTYATLQLCEQGLQVQVNTQTVCIETS